MFLPLSSWGAQKITVAFGNALAPWVIPETNSGILITLVKEALAPEGYEINALYYPYARRITSYKFKQVDAACDVSLQVIEQESLEGYLSDDAYAYENIAVALKKNNFKFTRISDLASHSLMSWQGASSRMGEEYATMIENNANYRENYNQELQVKMLFLERFEVIQLDQQIFNYYRAKINEKGGIDTTLPVDSFPLFGQSVNSIIFHDEKIRDAFNKGLKRLRESGQYDAIFNAYINPN